MKGTTAAWYGLAPDGSEVMIDHGKLMEWAFDHDLQITVGWSHRFEQDGKRLVRGPRMLAEAKAAGWDDLAEKLEAFGFKDEP